jgi:hypothetical protein
MHLGVRIVRRSATFASAASFVRESRNFLARGTPFNELEDAVPRVEPKQHLLDDLL